MKSSVGATSSSDIYVICADHAGNSQKFDCCPCPVGGEFEPCLSRERKLNQQNTQGVLVVQSLSLRVLFVFHVVEWWLRAKTKNYCVTLLNSTTFDDHWKNRSIKNCHCVGHLNSNFTGRGPGIWTKQSSKFQMPWGVPRGVPRGCWSFEFIVINKMIQIKSSDSFF